MLEIKESVAVITGGGSGGIGLALARYWVQNGGKVVLADVMEDAYSTPLLAINPVFAHAFPSGLNFTIHKDCIS